MSENLGKAVLDLEANLDPFVRNMRAGKKEGQDFEHMLEGLAALSKVAEDALKQVKTSPGQVSQTVVSMESILEGVRGVKDESRDAARQIDDVRITQAQAAESVAAGEEIKHNVNDIGDEAEKTSRALDRVKLRLAALGHGAGSSVGRTLTPGGRPGFGPFGAGFGRVGVLGTLVGVGAVTAPAAGPAAIGLLAGIPTLGAAALGVLGTLTLALGGVGKAIGGDKKAFDALTPSAQKFVLTVRSLDGLRQRFKETAARSLFPGLTEGLKSALSPGTVNAIGVAIVRLGQALGAAGAQWGKYFGSPQFQRIFGPLMQAAARSISVLSDASLHLFDALGVLGRAAIPFVNWLNEAIDRGSKLADTWIRGKESSGALAHGMDEAKTSLALVARLAASLVNVIIALGAALYPVAKGAVKDLTDGFNELAGIIRRNEGAIRTIASTLILGLKTAIEGVVKGLGLLRDAFAHFVGKDKASIIIAITAIGIALAFALGPESAVIIGAIAAVGLIRKHWETIADFFRTLGQEVVNAFTWLWNQLERMALKAALAVVEPFSHLPFGLGKWAQKAKDNFNAELAKIHPPNMDWSAAAAQAGVKTGDTWAKAFNATMQSEIGHITAAPSVRSGVFDNHNPATYGQTGTHVKAPASKSAEPKPGTHEWYMKYLGYDPTVGSVFGTPPPFTKNLGSTAGSKPAVIPAEASHLEALASQNASRAAALHNVGAKAKKFLEDELAELQKADKIVTAKYKDSTGKVRTQLFAEITRIENQIRTVKGRIAKAITSDREAELKYAVDQAKLAVQNAKEGTSAYDTAVAAEEKALKAYIAYLDKRAHNMKLAVDARDKAVRAEIAAKKELDKLMHVEASASAQNEAQFLSLFKGILTGFGPNVFPDPNQQQKSGATDTHLYDIKTELRQQTPYIKDAATGTRFGATSYALATAGAVAG